MAVDLGNLSFRGLARWKGFGGRDCGEQLQELSEFKELKGQCGWNTDSNGRDLGNQWSACRAEDAGPCQPSNHFCL